MSINGLIICVLVIFSISFLYLRGFLSGVKRYQLNNSAYKKRKKDESWVEWLFYTKYKEEIPSVLRVFYYVVLALHMLCVIVLIILGLLDMPTAVGAEITKSLWVIDGLWIVVIALLFWSPGPGYAYDRWISKKRGEKKRK